MEHKMLPECAANIAVLKEAKINFDTSLKEIKKDIKCLDRKIVEIKTILTKRNSLPMDVKETLVKREKLKNKAIQAGIGLLIALTSVLTTYFAIN